MFWEQLSKCERDQVLVMGDLSAEVSTVAVEGITERPGMFSEVTGNGEQLLELCADKGLVTRNV